MLTTAVFAQKQYHYETMPNDPLKARIYTLDNGLKVYMTANKEVPYVSFIVGIKAGNKHDVTGFQMANLVQHCVVSGTKNTGALHWEKEQPLLQQIEVLNEHYCQSTDSTERAQMFAQLDSLSYEASKYAVGDEHAKIGAMLSWENDDNANEDFTTFTGNIAKNRLESWAHFQAEALINPVFRLFYKKVHQFPMSYPNPLERKDLGVAFTALYPHHPYSKQTTDHAIQFLQNPSLQSVKDFYNRYYVPNNTAIALSGDLDFEATIAIIDQYFGQWEAKSLPPFYIQDEAQLKEPIEKEAVATTDMAMIAYRIDLPARAPERQVLNIMMEVLKKRIAEKMAMNKKLNKAGEYPIDIANCHQYADNAIVTLYGMPNEDETLEALYMRMLSEVDSVKKGKFPEEWVQESIRQARLEYEYTLTMNRERADWMMNAFLNEIPWKEASSYIEPYQKITPQDVINFANKYLNKNHLVLYKREGKSPVMPEFAYPTMIPIEKNDTLASPFYTMLKAQIPPLLPPVFVDFEKVIQKEQIKKTDLYYIENELNNEFELQVRFPVGVLNDLQWDLASYYFAYLGASGMDAFEWIKKKKAYSSSIFLTTSNHETVLTMKGLDDTFVEVIQMAVEQLTNATVDEEAFNELIASTIQDRARIKKNEAAYLAFLKNYVEYGKEQINYQLLDEALKQIKASDVIALMQSLLLYQSEMYYFGPRSLDEVKSVLNTHFPILKKGKKDVEARTYERIEAEKNQLYLVDTVCNNVNGAIFSYGSTFDVSLIPYIELYNLYMKMVLYRMRNDDRSMHHLRVQFIAEERSNAKMSHWLQIAMDGENCNQQWTKCMELLDTLPVYDDLFEEAKKMLVRSLRNMLISETKIFEEYRKTKKMGLNDNIHPHVYEQMQQITWQDMVDFHEQHIKNQKRAYMIIGNKEKIDFDQLEPQLGKVIEVSLEDIFGY